MKIVLAPLAALALTSGCMVAERTYDNMELDSDRFALPSNFSNYADDGLRPLSGRLEGDMGPTMRSMDDIAQLNGYHDVGYTNLEVIVTNDRGSAMALLDFQGGIDHPALQPGERLTFSSMGPTADTPDDLYVSALACAGEDEPGNWSYDTPSEQVEVEVQETENPDVLRYNFTTVQDGDVATGHIDVVSPR